MKRYKLQSIVSNGTHASNKVKPDLLVGDVSNGYGQGDILDANATKELISEKVSEVTGGISGNMSEEINSLKGKDSEHDQKIANVEEKVNSMNVHVDDGDNLVITL